MLLSHPVRPHGRIAGALAYLPILERASQYRACDPRRAGRRRWKALHRDGTSWDVLRARLFEDESRDIDGDCLDVDCLAVGLATVETPAVHIDRILHLEGEIHEEPRTLRSHCASLVAIWSAVQAPSIVDFDACACVGRRLLARRPASRRFAIHAQAGTGSQVLFVVISATRPWPDVAGVKHVIDNLVSEASRLHAMRPAIPGNVPRAASEGLDWYLFTAREAEILRLVAGGLSNKQIARELGSSPNTVRNQIHAVFRKAGVSNRTELALRVASSS
ncbi:response regulator transcription factor [Lysobacter sp. SG-8]|uniref:Response regulator transcription factor n=1 Tax=Marilutibacter penaei TaxID=2759900 RepID=A0A7W3YE03_9GAMM|nr:response regulator transcription factor [Lysobacter penaei]